MLSLAAGWRRNNSVGGKATRTEEISIDTCVGVLGGRVDAGEAATLRNNSSQSMALGGESFDRVEHVARSKAVDGFLTGFLCLCSHLVAGDRTRVRQIKLLGVFRIKVRHEDLEGLVVVTAGNSIERGPNRDLGTFNLQLRLGSTSSVEHVIEIFDLLLPATVRTLLLLGEEKVLAAVKDAVRGRSGLDVVGRIGIVVGESVLGSNVKHALKTKEKGGGAAGLQNDLVRKDKHARLGEKLTISSMGTQVSAGTAFRPLTGAEGGRVVGLGANQTSRSFSGPSKALVESRSAATSWLIVRWGVADAGEKVQLLGTEVDSMLAVYLFLCPDGRVRGALAAAQTDYAASV
ncbi:hypothetical protein HG530_005749 [Fusarium avenaceum]|nr:hypothetical protein HG530_005749 [Fusarium avenaceum]